jgi:hypothetical protein
MQKLFISAVLVPCFTLPNGGDIKAVHLGFIAKHLCHHLWVQAVKYAVAGGKHIPSTWCTLP